MALTPGRGPLPGDLVFFIQEVVSIAWARLRNVQRSSSISWTPTTTSPPNC
jgi:hypothetical protein